MPSKPPALTRGGFTLSEHGAIIKQLSTKGYSMCVASKYMKLRSFNKRMVVEVETTVVAGRWVSVKVPRLRSLRDYWSSL